MNFIYKTATFAVAILSFCHNLYSQSIEEKLLSFENKTSNNSSQKVLEDKIDHEYKELIELHNQVEKLAQSEAQSQDYLALLEKIQSKRCSLDDLEALWISTHPSPLEVEETSLLNEEDASLFNLILEYGCHQTLYIVPPELRAYPIHLASQIPIPKESWDDVLSIILRENGIGIEKLNPFVKKLYSLHENFDGVKIFQSSSSALNELPDDQRIGFFIPMTSDTIDTTISLLEKFSSPQKSSIYPIQDTIFVIAPVAEVKKVVQLCHFISSSQAKTDFAIHRVAKGDLSSIKEALNEYFQNKSRNFSCSTIDSDSKIIFLKGSKDDIEMAKTILQELESNFAQKVRPAVYCYSCKNSDAASLGSVLEKCYPLLIGNERSEKSLSNPPTPMYYNQANETSKSHFIVDEKTDTLVMVVQSSILPTLLDLLKKIDIPKKMVQLEVLFFEKRIKESNNFGLNQLNIGKNGGSIGGNGASWQYSNGSNGATPTGIFDFFLSKGKHKGIPAYDLSYQFLISQEDIQINTCPTVTTINQTPAIIRLVDEISINTGVVAFGNGNDQNSYLKDSYSREEFGVILEITPTINEVKFSSQNDSKSYVTLKTNISFESNNSRPSNTRPDITKRKIENEVRVADGEPFIIGGLRKKLSSTAKDAFPLLGSLPGIGNLFSYNEDAQGSTEMFVCITPKIIGSDDEVQSAIEKIKLQFRQGDCDELTLLLEEAKEYQNTMQLSHVLNLVMQSDEKAIDGEYDGQ